MKDENQGFLPTDIEGNRGNTDAAKKDENADLELDDTRFGGKTYEELIGEQEEKLQNTWVPKVEQASGHSGLLTTVYAEGEEDELSIFAARRAGGRSLGLFDKNKPGELPQEDAVVERQEAPAEVRHLYSPEPVAVTEDTPKKEKTEASSTSKEDVAVSRPSVSTADVSASEDAPPAENKEKKSAFSYLFEEEERDPYDILIEQKKQQKKMQKEQGAGKTTEIPVKELHSQAQILPEQESECADYSAMPFASYEIPENSKVKDLSAFGEDSEFFLHEAEEEEDTFWSRLLKKFFRRSKEEESEEEFPVNDSLTPPEDTAAVSDVNAIDIMEQESTPYDVKRENLTEEAVTPVPTQSEKRNNQSDKLPQEEASKENFPKENSSKKNDSPVSAPPEEEELIIPDPLTLEDAEIQTGSGVIEEPDVRAEESLASETKIVDSSEPIIPQSVTTEEQGTKEQINEQKSLESSEAQRADTVEAKEKIAQAQEQPILPPQSPVVAEKREKEKKAGKVQGPYIIYSGDIEEKVLVFTPEHAKPPLLIPLTGQIYEPVVKEYEQAMAHGTEHTPPVRFIPHKIQEESSYVDISSFSAGEKPAKKETTEQPLPEKTKKKPAAFKNDITDTAKKKAEVPIYADDGMRDFEKSQDAPAVRKEIFALYKQLKVKSLALGFLGFLLIVLSVLNRFSIQLPSFLSPGNATVGYIVLHLVFLLLACLLSFQTLKGGLRALFHLQGDADTAIAAAAVLCVAHNLYLLADPAAVSTGNAFLYAPVIILGLFLNTLGKMLIMKRTRNNFRYVSSAEPKYAMHTYDDRDGIAKMVGLPDAAEPSVAYYGKTGLLAKFLHISYAYDTSEQMSQKLSLIGVLASLGVAILNFIITMNFSGSLQTLCVAACVCVPVTNMLCVNVPVYLAGKRLLKKGAMLSGCAAVERFGDVNYIVVKDTDLFPKHSVTLHLLKTFSQQRVDEAILDAAALMCATNGPMSDMFEQIILGKAGVLPKVESVQYEDEKGVVGWVGGRRVLIGNGGLMEQYGITSPSKDYEQKYAQNSQLISYLAVGGELVAMFVMDYAVEHSTADHVQELLDSGVSLLVHTMDSNITPAMLSEKFAAPIRSFRVVPSEQGKVLETLQQETAQSDALLGVSGRLSSLAAGLSACKKLKGITTLSVLLQTIGVVLGFALVLFLVAASGIFQMGVFELLMFELFWTAAVLAVCLIRKY